MVSKSRIKFIKSLQLKKNRQTEGLFVAEGQKLVQELLESDWEVEELLVSQDLRDEFPSADTICNGADMSRMSSLKQAPGVLAVVKQKEVAFSNSEKFVFALDGIRDPGNLGTIIRCADWFGIQKIVCSEDTVDLYNPKVVQATMGSIWRVEVSYADLGKLLEASDRSVYGLDMKGASLYETQFGEGIFVIGNESQGIRPEISSQITQYISIPGRGKAESLNASISGAIVLSELNRQAIGKG